MQDTAMSRWLSPLMAFCLSFIIIVGLAPSLGLQIDRQLDFWLLWFATMLFLALPIIYLEIGLAKRAQTSALNALSKLTREADAHQRWRVVGWLAVIFIPFLAGGILLNTSNAVAQQNDFGIGSNILMGIAAFIAFGLSFLQRSVLVVLTAIATIASLVAAQVFGVQVNDWQLTPVEFKEWGSATILALVASGLGLGLYWQTNLNQEKQDAATPKTLPIWLAQLVAVAGFGYFAISAAIPAYIVLIATIFAVALLLQLGKEQLVHRGLAQAVQYILLLAPLLIWVFPAADLFLTPILMLWGLSICLIYAIFVGWIMKISHLRKALNFSNEAFYNIWRVAVRIVTPLAIVVAMISYLGQLLP
ncbi:membrane protein [Acinetobacter sp. Ver3]|uniref:membrane protein n=1 Tax=Acinetobacter sp. Ver3 TaxID=466088 RepID=UPI00044DCB8C|nr:membrane protein [Acinetobacter sp. Ver3]EZQ09950.1 membrane protein [Acinetobacter sp. Ver3]